MSSQFVLLKSSRFLPLFLAQFFGTFNSNLFKNALIIFITYQMTQTKNPQLMVTLAAGIFILPFFLFSATAGELADKYEKSFLITIIKFVEIFFMIMASFALYSQNSVFLLGILFFIGAQSTFFGPLKYAILPETLNNTELLAGNGLIEAGTFLAILLGTLLGGLLILYPHGVAMISTMVCCVAIIGFISSLFIPKTATRNAKLSIHVNFIRETWNIIRYSQKEPGVFPCIMGISWFWLVGATFLAEFAVFAKNDLHADSTVVTFFFFLFSMGIALGSILCNKLLKGKIHAKFVPFGALGLTLFTFDLYFAAGATTLHPKLISLSAFLQTLQGIRITLDLLLLAICSGLYTVPLYTLLQFRSASTHMARVIASNNIMNALFMVFSAIATMVMLKKGFTVSQVFLALAYGNTLVTLYITHAVYIKPNSRSTSYQKKI